MINFCFAVQSTVHHPGDINFQIYVSGHWESSARLGWKVDGWVKENVSTQANCGKKVLHSVSAQKKSSPILAKDNVKQVLATQKN